MTYHLHHLATTVVADVLARQLFARQWCDVAPEIGKGLEDQAREIVKELGPLLRAEDGAE